MAVVLVDRGKTPPVEQKSMAAALTCLSSMPIRDDDLNQQDGVEDGGGGGDDDGIARTTKTSFIQHVNARRLVSIVWWWGIS